MARMQIWLFKLLYGETLITVTCDCGKITQMKVKDMNLLEPNQDNK